MSVKDDLVSSRPISPSEFLQFPVDEVKDVIDGGVGGVDDVFGGSADLTSGLEHSFSPPQNFFVGNGTAFDPYHDPFQDFSPPYDNLSSDAADLKRNNPFQSGFLVKWE